MRTNTRQPRAAVIAAFHHQTALDWQNNPPPGWIFTPVEPRMGYEPPAAPEVFDPATAVYVEHVNRYVCPPPEGRERPKPRRVNWELCAWLGLVLAFWAAVVWKWWV